jgi:hypothetical protein
MLAAEVQQRPVTLGQHLLFHHGRRMSVPLRQERSDLLPACDL